MKKVNEMSIKRVEDDFYIDEVLVEAVPATLDEIRKLKTVGFDDSEPCGRNECIDGWVWVLIDAPSGNGCQWYKTNARCNE